MERLTMRVDGQVPSAGHPDADHQRDAAHRLYLHMGFLLSSHHLALPL